MATTTQAPEPSVSTTGPREKPTEKKTEAKEEKTLSVTSTKTVDFPSLNWGIHAGETRELPVDEAAQQIILEKDFITLN